MSTDSKDWTGPVVIIAGSLRSGTTLLRLMLAEHSGLMADHEYDFLLDVLNSDGSTPDSATLHQRLRGQRIFKQLNYGLSKSASYRDMLERVLRELCVNDSVPVLALHREFSNATRIFPNAKFIHLIRDPRDVAQSSMKMGWSGNLYFACGHWVDTELQWEQASQIIRPQNQLTVSYEELVRDPESTVLSICKFLDIDFHPSMIDGYAQQSTYSSPDANLAEQWKRNLSDQEIALVEARAGGLLEVRGYVRSQPPLQLSKARQLALRIGHSVGRNRFSMRRFGASLVLKEKFGRWFGLNQWHLRVLDQIHRIENQYDR